MGIKGIGLSSDFMADASKGHLEDHIPVADKFGRATKVGRNIPTDTWDRANADDDQPLFIPPSAPQIHNLKSTDVDDNEQGSGLQTLLLYGLPDWHTVENVETVVMGGLSDVPTQIPYAIIHRLRAKTWGTTAQNVGTITATDAVGGEVTAQITAGKGQTQMAILAFPSVQTFYMTQYYASLIMGGANGGGEGSYAEVSLLVNPRPHEVLEHFLVKPTRGLSSPGTSDFNHPFRPYRKFPGPAIIKIQSVGSVQSGLDLSAGFAGFLVNNPR